MAFRNATSPICGDRDAFSKAALPARAEVSRTTGGRSGARLCSRRMIAVFFGVVVTRRPADSAPLGVWSRRSDHRAGDGQPWCRRAAHQDETSPRSGDYWDLSRLTVAVGCAASAPGRFCPDALAWACSLRRWRCTCSGHRSTASRSWRACRPSALRGTEPRAAR